MEVIYWVVISLMGAKQGRLLELAQELDSLEKLFEDEEVSGKIEKETLEELKSKLSEAENILKRVEKYGIEILPLQDPRYPELLKNSRYPPPVLYIKGNINFHPWSISIVGTRKPSHYGRKVARELSFDLAESGAIVVSGGARGIDTEVHRGAIEAGGKTVAVLGCGIDITYPPENKKLFKNIMENGALVSEFPPGTLPLPYNFPRRNRIIAGLSRGVIVVEAGTKSGALNTAKWALDEGREVFAVPGPITSEVSKGTNFLIKEGARLVTSAQDVFEEFGFFVKKREKEIKTTEEEDELLRLMSFEPIHLDELIRRAGKPEGYILSLLLRMEMKGIVTQLPGKYYVKNV